MTLAMYATIVRAIRLLLEVTIVGLAVFAPRPQSARPTGTHVLKLAQVAIKPRTRIPLARPAEASALVLKGIDRRSSLVLVGPEPNDPLGKPAGFIGAEQRRL